MQYTPRKLLFKAWNQETGLLMRLNTIECVKGELFRKDHILLQFTGFHDKQNEEVYEMDVLLIDSKKFIVSWDTDQNRWSLSAEAGGGITGPFTRKISEAAVRICSYFESQRSLL